MPLFGVIRRVFGTESHGEPLQEFAESLIAALTVVLVLRLAKQGGQFSTRHGVTACFQDGQHGIFVQVEGNANLLEFGIVAQFSAWLRLRFACRRWSSSIDDETIQEATKHVVIAVFGAFLAFAAHKCMGLFDGHGLSRQREDGHHFLVGHVQCIAESAQGIVVVHGASDGSMPGD